MKDTEFKEIEERLSELGRLMKEADKDKIPPSIYCLDIFEKLPDYHEGSLLDKERQQVEEHFKKCLWCFNSYMKYSISIAQAEVGTLPDAPQWVKDIGMKVFTGWSYEEIIGVIKKDEARQKVEALVARLKELIAKTPVHLQERLGTVFRNLEVIFQETFAYPTPSFAPVFGEIQITVLSPFGKMRYPILFEWQSYEEADEYIITIEDVDWSITTSKTKLEITPENLKLEYGQEYMWNLKAIKKGEILEEENGVFSLIDKIELKEVEEIESQIKDIEPEEDKLILWGGILEEKELYIDAIQKYKQAYAIQSLPGVAYRIACCYDKLELEDLREEWNKRISKEI